jgi:hypothetical protein
MLQVNNSDPKTFKIKSIRKADESERIPHGSACSLEAGNGTEKPPC